MSTSRLNTAFLLSMTSAWAHPTFVYTNNNGSVNTVSAFSVGANGVLTPVPGSPFPTGGTGGPSPTGSTQIITTLAKHFVYVTNAGSSSQSSTISAFSIDPSTGKLTLVPGSPFPSGAGGIGGLAITPDDQYLVITNDSLAQIAVDNIGTDGTLTAVPGSPFAGSQALLQTADPKVTPDGKFLAVSSVTNIGAGVVAMFNLTSAGAVSFDSVSNAGADTGIDCNCASSHLYAGSSRVKLVNGMPVPDPAVDAYTIGPTGVLTPLPGSPFFAPGGLDVLLSPNGGKLFASGLSSGISVFNVASNGALSAVPGSPFSAGLGTDSIAINNSGRFIYAADVTSHSIFAFHVSANGALTPVPGSPFSSGSLDGPVGVTVYPPKTCCPAPELHEVSASPNALSPANSSLVEVAIDYMEAGENSDGEENETPHGQGLPCPNTCVISVSSNQPPIGAANGTSSADWKVVDAHHVLLRAQQSGNDTRIYAITITCTNDSNGLSSSRKVTVRVPHDQED